MKLLAISLIAVLVGIISCLNTAFKTAIEYPPTWPDSTITAPDGSTRAVHNDVLYGRIHNYDSKEAARSDGTKTRWGIYYANQFSWDDNVEHLESCLRGRGYLKLLARDDSAVRKMDFWSGDHTVFIVLWYWKRENIYELSTTIFEPTYGPIRDGYTPLD